MSAPVKHSRRAPDRTTRSNRTNQLLAQAQAADGAERQRLIDEVVVANVEVARSIARRYRNRGIPVEDLEQVACLALVRAANRFEPDKAEDFLTYAVPTISGEVKRYFRDHGWAVRPPRRVQEVQALLAQDAKRSGGVQESPEEIAARLGVSVEEVARAEEAQGCFVPVSLDAPVGHADHAEARGDLLVDEDQFTEWDAAEARTILRTLTKHLKPRDRLILYLRFVEDRTQAEIGAELGVTQMQVSRLLSRILSDMRERLGASAEVDVA